MYWHCHPWWEPRLHHLRQQRSWSFALHCSTLNRDDNDVDDYDDDVDDYDDDDDIDDYDDEDNDNDEFDGDDDEDDDDDDDGHMEAKADAGLLTASLSSTRAILSWTWKPVS